MYDWNDLKYLVAVARHGSTSAAARSIGVNGTTVQRRLAETERQLGYVLIERQQSGYRLTAIGEAVLPHAESVASAALAFEQHLKDALRVTQSRLRINVGEFGGLNEPRIVVSFKPPPMLGTQANGE